MLEKYLKILKNTLEVFEKISIIWQRSLLGKFRRKFNKNIEKFDENLYKFENIFRKP